MPPAYCGCARGLNFHSNAFWRENHTHATATTQVTARASRPASDDLRQLSAPSATAKHRAGRRERRHPRAKVIDEGQRSRRLGGKRTIEDERQQHETGQAERQENRRRENPVLHATLLHEFYGDCIITA